MKCLIYAFVLFGASLSIAQFATPDKGEYVISEGAWGNLHVQTDKKFKIETVGGNAHTCELSGVISNGKSTIENSSCEVTFRNKGLDVEVATNGSKDCLMFCGMRAEFAGIYRKPGPLCTSSSISNSKEIFKKRYVAKDYAAALAVISPIATQCKQFLDWIDSAWILNDLALTQFKLGNWADCLKTLEPLRKDAALSEEGIRKVYPPTDADNYLPVVDATRTNLKLCSTR